MNQFVHGVRRWIRTRFAYIFGYPAIRTIALDYEEYWMLLTQGERREDIPFSTYRVIESWIEDGSSVLDIGCGDGAFLEYISQYKTIEAHGIDISERALELARARGIHTWVANAASPNFRLDQQYDYIVMTEFLEHIPNPETLLAKVKDKFRKGLIVSVPNTGAWPYRARILLGRFPVQWAHHPAEHLRFWTVKDFVWWAEQLGFEVRKLEGTYGTRLFRLYKRAPNIFAMDFAAFLTTRTGVE